MDVRNINCMSRYYIPLYGQLPNKLLDNNIGHNGHYMLNEYHNLHIGQKINGNTCLPDGKYSRLSLLGKNMKTCNKLIISC